jgi:NADH:ubiquinone oxidoreductase subunit H
MRASAQMISYEIAMGFALVTVLLTSGSLNLSSIVASQGQGYFAEYRAEFSVMELAAITANVRDLLYLWGCRN